ncbi:hypothetical protein STENM223S_08610 [Streptomyces tendae]
MQNATRSKGDPPLRLPLRLLVFSSSFLLASSHSSCVIRGSARWRGWPSASRTTRRRVVFFPSTITSSDTSICPRMQRDRTTLAVFAAVQRLPFGVLPLRIIWASSDVGVFDTSSLSHCAMLFADSPAMRRRTISRSVPAVSVP